MSDEAITDGAPEGWVPKVKAALEAYYEVNRNFRLSGGTLTEQRFSEGEREDRAKEVMYEELCSLTPDDLRTMISVALAKAHPQGGES